MARPGRLGAAMKLLPGSAVAVAIALMLSVQVVSASAAPSEDVDECPAAGTVLPQSAFETLSEGTCDLTFVQVQLDAGPIATIPQPNETIGQFSSQPLGGTIPDVVTYQDETGDVAIQIDDVVIGDDSAVDPDGTADPAAEPDSTVGGARCSTANAKAYKLKSSAWYDNTFKWWYNDDHSEGSGSLDRIKAAINTWNSGTTGCGFSAVNNLSVSYQPGGSDANYKIGVNGAGNCSGYTGHSVVGWGPMSNGAIATTCTYSFGTQLTESDVKLNTNVTLYRGSSASGCSGDQYDLQYTATHEFGHAIGLDHSAQSANQIMKPTQGNCYTTRTLGRGDAAGLTSWY